MPGTLRTFKIFQDQTLAPTLLFTRAHAWAAWVGTTDSDAVHAAYVAPFVHGPRSGGGRGAGVDAGSGSGRGAGVDGGSGSGRGYGRGGGSNNYTSSTLGRVPQNVYGSYGSFS